MSKAETKKNKNEGRKRFTDKQISFLEYMYETQTRPELRMKHQVANKLGLHPRQVAIWFQNKRARSKSRQIEHEYNILKQNYETLASKSESLKKENQALVNQLEMLRNVAERRQENVTGNSSSEESDDRGTNSPTKSDANVMMEKCGRETYVPFSYFGGESEYLEIEEQLCSVNELGEMHCGFGPELQNWWEV
ncbi:homeobox-leucine zipper protein HOX22-like [Rutidosis leptorrhynchoides]|uniref:homeobox-leucine zipper protein HOX22-like n=1 Tax=Rutidosis leptorrhynchoides TaxID=125765 RepID=UPI003A993915